MQPDVVVSGVDEDVVAAHSPAALAEELAGLKCRAVADRVPPGGPTLVMGCDSVLELEVVTVVGGRRFERAVPYRERHEGDLSDDQRARGQSGKRAGQVRDAPHPRLPRAPAQRVAD